MSKLHPIMAEALVAGGIPAELVEPRAVPFSPTTFHAFKVCEDRTYTLGEIDARTLEEARNGAVTRWALFHKDHLLIRESGERGVRLHLFAVKRKSAPRYVWENHAQKRVFDLYAAPVCTIDGGALHLSSTSKGRGVGNASAISQ